MPSDSGFLRFVAGMRALFAVVASIGLFGLAPDRDGAGPFGSLFVLPYLVWSAFLLWKTSRGWFRAASRVWPWIDAAFLLCLFEPMSPLAPLVAVLTLLPVVVVALLGGAVHGTALALACAATMLALLGWQRGVAALPPLSLGIPIALLALGPAAALLVHPSRELQQRSQLLDGFKELSDPRQGLRHHVDLLLGQLAARFELKLAILSVRGPEPRIFRWRPDGEVQALNEAELQAWREKLEALPRDCDLLSNVQGSEHAIVALDPWRGARRSIEAPAREAMRSLGMNAIAIPLLSYGQPQGQLCLARTHPAFDRDDVHWLHGVMQDVLPLLERSDLLEQLQRESAARERERIGRDLHDSAIQPYLGLKYGLEALVRRTRADNPVRPDVEQLLQIATDELQTLRDVVSGLRRGHEPAGPSAPLVALQRQVERFEALYGLKVNIYAAQAPHLRGSVAKALLHMVNEALTNVRRHTSATAVTVMIDVDASHVVLRLRNDHGPGEALPREFVPLSLRERATEFGGSVAVSHEQDFTEVAVTLPLMSAIG